MYPNYALSIQMSFVLLALHCCVGITTSVVLNYTFYSSNINRLVLKWQVSLFHKMETIWYILAICRCC